MDVAEFDTVAEEYQEQHRSNIAITGEAPEYFAEYKINLVRQFTGQKNLDAAHILDFGSGIGNSIPHFNRFFPAAKLTCADVSQRSLDIANSRFPGLGQNIRIEGAQLPFHDESFDVAFSACVFHHIPHAEHVHWLKELRRVTRPGGIVAIFEHNPLNPLTVHAVNTCPFDVNAKLIRAGNFVKTYQQAGWQRPSVRYHLFFPRALAALRGLERHLSRVAIGAQYSIVATKSH